MTTIAWDGRTVAGDTLVSRGCLRNLVTTKVWKLTDGSIYGASGDHQDCMLVKAWIEEGMNPSSKPQIKEDAFTAILVKDGKCTRLESKLIPLEVFEPFHAIGNGRDFAIAAMHLGKSAREAVEIACLYDIYTGGVVTECPDMSLHQHDVPLTYCSDTNAWSVAI